MAKRIDEEITFFAKPTDSVGLGREILIDLDFLDKNKKSLEKISKTATVEKNTDNKEYGNFENLILLKFIINQIVKAENLDKIAYVTGWIDSDGNGIPTSFDKKVEVEIIKYFNIDKFVQTLQSNAKPSTLGKCAKHVRLALEAGGADTTNHPISASDYAPILIKNNFYEVNSPDYTPKKGDIYIIERFGTHTHGHIAGYDGSQWISDFKQKNANIYNKQNVIFHFFTR